MEHKNLNIILNNGVIVMSFNTVLYGGISLIIIGLILYGVSCYMVRYYEKKEREINKHIFEILRPKPKGKK